MPGTRAGTAADELVAALSAEPGRIDPNPLYARLHRLGGACALTPGDRPFAAVVHGYDPVDQVLRDPGFLVADSDHASADWRRHPVLVMLLNSMMFSNGERHTRMRGLFSRVFTPRRVQAMEPLVAGIATELLDRMGELGADGRELDYMAEFAYPLPALVVGRVLGLPEDDIGWFRAEVGRINDWLDLRRPDPAVKAAADAAAATISAYYLELIADRRRRPRADLVSELVQARDEGPGQLDDEELAGNLLVLFNASFSTTIHLLGNALPLLLDRPALLDRLSRDPAVAPAYIEEVLRYDTPAHVFVRVAAADTEVAGVPIAAGALVLVLVGAANRDPRRFRRPDRFDVDRPDNQPISFGAGPHFCLGAALARTEARLALPALFQRFPGLGLGTPATRSEQFILRGYRTLPVRLGPG